MEKLNQEIENVLELISIFMIDINKKHYLTEIEIQLGQQIIISIAKIKVNELYKNINNVQIINKYFNKCLGIIKEVIEEDEYRKELEEDAVMVQKCLDKLNAQALRSK